MAKTEKTATPSVGAADERPTPTRRALVLATAAAGCAVAGMAGGPAIALALAPLATAGAGGRWVRTVKLDQLPEGEARRVSIVSERRDAFTVEKDVVLGSVWLVRRGNEVTAFSAVCPHLGCSVNASAAGDGKLSGFACPCHTSSFDPVGKRTSGPSPRDLDRLATRIEEGHVAVDFRRFRIGVEQKVET